MSREQPRQKPGWALLAVGVVYPALVIGFELITRFCAEIFFDPLPTLFHVLLVSLVPVSNALLWRHLRTEKADASNAQLPGLILLGGIAIGAAAFYTLVFLPLTLLAVIAIIVYGMGLLPLAPLASLAVAIMLYRRLRQRHADQLPARPKLWHGLAVSVTALALLDIQPAATLLGMHWAASGTVATRERGIRLLRSLGDDDRLLRYCYTGSRRATGPLSQIVQLWIKGPWQNTGRFTPTMGAREIFYRVTGDAFNQRPVPYRGGSWSRFEGFEFDSDQGGAAVGGRVKGLDLIASRIDASVDGDDAVAYLEWALEFRNLSHVQREARVRIALPPAAVVSRATLWVNGEEREAAFAGRGQVRQAYSAVVRRSRDPLLVTTRGADRVLAQAFPIAPNGGTLKFRLGISAPLRLPAADSTELVLPAIVDRNFNIGADLTHNIWIESEQPLETNLPEAESSRVSATLYRVNASVSDKVLSEPRKKLFAARNPEVTAVQSRFNTGDAKDAGRPITVVQNIEQRRFEPAGALMVVLDGSATLGAYRRQIASALEHIPAGLVTGLMIAGEDNIPVAPEPWSAAHKRRVSEAIATGTFIGGQDNAPALAAAMRALETHPRPNLLWIHGPQPVAFAGGATALAQTAERLTRLPDITLYAVRPGPNKLVDDTGWMRRAETLPKTGTVEEDLSDYFQTALAGGPRYTLQRKAATATAELPSGSSHIARLWARDKVRALIGRDYRSTPGTAVGEDDRNNPDAAIGGNNQNNPGVPIGGNKQNNPGVPTGGNNQNNPDTATGENDQNNLDAAIELAARYQLVTEVSGAVVLENLQQYRDSGLKPVDANTVPTIPEPRQWLLALVVMVLLLWFINRNRALLSGGH